MATLEKEARVLKRHPTRKLDMSQNYQKRTKRYLRYADGQEPAVRPLERRGRIKIQIAKRKRRKNRLHGDPTNHNKRHWTSPLHAHHSST